MASYRKLPPRKDGQQLWQASVALPIKLPSGHQKRATKTHTHKSVLKRWATELEADITAGRWCDPRGGQLTLREWREQWRKGRIAAGATTRKNDSHWRNHVEPRWGGHPLTEIKRGGLKEWVADMHGRQCPRCRTIPGLTRGGLLVKHMGGSSGSPSPCTGSGGPPGLGAWTIQGAVAHLSSMLSAAVEAGLLPANPAAGLPVPRADPRPVFYWTRDEADRLLAQLAGRPADQLLVGLDLHAGLRIGELLGLRRRYVGPGWLVHVVGVQTRDGWRKYPKSRKSRRAVPIPPHLRDRIAALCEGLGPDDHVFAAPGGAAWDDRNWANRVFDPAVAAAGIRRGTPHDMRHTAASWLVQAGVDLYKVQALLGHEDFATTQKYAHLQPDAFDEVLAAWRPEPEPPLISAPIRPAGTSDEPAGSELGELSQPGQLSQAAVDASFSDLVKSLGDIGTPP